MSLERIKEKVSKLRTSENKYRRFLYWVIFFTYWIGGIILGLLTGFFFSDQFVHFQHTGWFGFSTFGYYNLHNFRTQFYENSTVSDQTLKVGNLWNNEVGTVTTIFVNPSDDIRIECKQGQDNSCNDYEIPAGSHTILDLEIIIGSLEREKYKLCFLTYEGNNKGNDYEECVDIIILPNK